VLLLDEPLAALDAGTRGSVRRDLRRHLETFDGMRLLVTHDPVDAYALADRVAILDAGRIVQVGTLPEVAAHPRSRYVADLVGVNLVTGEVGDGVLVTGDGARVVIADAPPGPSFAVIRPHSVIIERSHSTGSSARNVWPGKTTDVDRLGDRVRVGIDGVMPLTAEITGAALDALQLRPGDEVYASVKATDIDVYPA
jgi:molybdate transport system ATP-binding protein